MNKGKYVFAQIVEFLPQRIFDGIVEKYSGNKKVHSFTCWNQMLCMIFGQLTARDSLRDLIVSLEAHRNKFYHLGFGTSVSRRNIGHAKESRDYRIFEDFAMYMIETARKTCYRSDFEINVAGSIYAFDSSTIDLCLSVFWWAKFRKTKGGIKLHTLFDIRTSIPALVIITEANVADVTMLDELDFEVGSFYIVDKGYVDFARLYVINLCRAFFVIRAKKNTKFKRLYSRPKNPENGIKCDQIGYLNAKKSKARYPERIRWIKYYDKDLDKEFVFITNNFELEAEKIALLYKYRWQVELFFKWIKQHLKIRSFWGHSENAVKIQIYCAIISYCLVAIVSAKIKSEHSIYENLQILGFSLLDKTPINELLTKPQLQKSAPANCNQLILNL